MVVGVVTYHCPYLLSTNSCDRMQGFACSYSALVIVHSSGAVQVLVLYQVVGIIYGDRNTYCNIYVIAKTRTKY